MVWLSIFNTLVNEEQKLPIICFTAKGNNRIVIFAVFKRTKFKTCCFG